VWVAWRESAGPPDSGCRPKRHAGADPRWQARCGCVCSRLPWNATLLLSTRIQPTGTVRSAQAYASRFRDQQSSLCVCTVAVWADDCISSWSVAPAFAAPIQPHRASSGFLSPLISNVEWGSQEGEFTCTAGKAEGSSCLAQLSWQLACLKTKQPFFHLFSRERICRRGRWWAGDA